MNLLPLLTEIPIFSVNKHLSLILNFNIPFLLILRYMLINPPQAVPQALSALPLVREGRFDLLGFNSEFERGFRGQHEQKKLARLTARVRDLCIQYILTLSGLFAIALSLTFLSSFTPDAQTAPFLAAPRTFFGFFVLVLSCLSTAYLEEGFFRVYFLEKCACSAINRPFLTRPSHTNGKAESACGAIAAAVSALCFAAFHLWEGFWGTFNALFAAVFLSSVYLKTKNIHLIALSHAAYNLLVYMMS